MNAVRLNRPAPRMQGFTLIEIMVVVVILGLLAALVAPNIIGNVDKAAVARAKQDIRSVETALKLYRMENFRYPNTDEGLAALISPEQGGPFLDKVPNDPWETPYQYRYPGTEGEFDVFTLGADRQAGGDGVNTDMGNWNLD
jgi:general secretion pathway protein G